MYLSKLKRIYVRKGWELMQNNGVIQKKFMWTVKGPNKFWTKANENCYLPHARSKVFWSLSVSIAGIFMISEKKIVKWQTSRNERCDSISRKNNLDLQKNLFGQWKVRTNFESKHTKIATFHTISSKVFRSLSVSVADKFMMSRKKKSLKWN